MSQMSRCWTAFIAVAFVQVAFSLSILDDSRIRIEQQLEQLHHDIQPLLHDLGGENEALEVPQLPPGCMTGVSILTAGPQAPVYPVAICVEILAHAVARQHMRNADLVEAWFLHNSNPAWTKNPEMVFEQFNPYVRPKLKFDDNQDFAVFYSTVLTSMNGEGTGGMCPMSTATHGGSVFLVSLDKSVLLKSMVANEAQNWKQHDQHRLDQGTYPEAILPALAFFKFDEVYYFLMPGAARMGNLVNVPGMKLLDMKGLVGREGTDEVNLMTKFPEGLGIPSTIWMDIALRTAQALDFLVGAGRMDYSMLMTTIPTSLDLLDPELLSQISNEFENGVFVAPDMHAVLAVEEISRTPLLVGRNSYAFQLQGFSDHLETFENKTTSTMSALLINGIRADLMIESNPIQRPLNYACRMYVFLATFLFVPVNPSYNLQTKLWPKLFQHRFDTCVHERSVVSFHEHLAALVEAANTQQQEVAPEEPKKWIFF
eukprot:c5899_g1_i1.p1 GENE.c5899_g1_i1~~c5899_g1_i1.p1  ORF type:complete len:485 (-),score=125.11 c5899_g1_i1:76-1530(-)